ncbi:hypothetical protein BOX15_Mlig002551g1 [Macrostomum lignano]|uniref:WD_REPEATS_REGION domain-containing protein n=2 Tax=Macrostomum lignano TaxID=282301 RepID=A0A267EQD1_9PLAT|nr:hypothetical protein BOX15_Mlig002551g1 [Macrostomum lignano]
MDLLLTTESQLTIYNVTNNSVWNSTASVTPCSSSDYVSHVQLAPCGQYALALSESGRHLLQIPLASLSDQLSHRQLPVAGQHSCIALSPYTGRSLSAGSHTGQLTVYDAPEGHCRWQRPSLPSPVVCLAFDLAARDDSRCLIGYQSGDVALVNIGTGYRHSPMGLRPEDRSACECLATSQFCPGVAAAGYRSGALLLWDTNSGSSRSVLACPSRESGSTGFCQPRRAVQFSPVNASLLCSTSCDSSAGLYDSLAGIEVGRIRLPDAATRGLTFSPDGQLVLVGTRTSGCLAYDLRRMHQPVMQIPAAAADTAADRARSAAVIDLKLIPQRREFDLSSPTPTRHKPEATVQHNENPARPLVDLTNRHADAPSTPSNHSTLSATKDSSGGLSGDSSAEGRALDRILMAPLQLTMQDHSVLPPNDASNTTATATVSSQSATKRVTFAESLAVSYSMSGSSPVNPTTTISRSSASATSTVDVACQTTDATDSSNDSFIRQLIRDETRELRRQLNDLRYQLVHQLDITETNLMDAIRQAVLVATTAHNGAVDSTETGSNRLARDTNQLDGQIIKFPHF